MDEPITVLFVDDEVDILRALRRAVLGESFVALTAGSGPEALEILAGRHVDLVISDLEMPGMNGTELLREVRRRHPRTLRALLTASATVAYLGAAINEGEVVRYFPKPFEPAAFRAALSSLADQITRARAAERAEARAAERARLLQRLEERYPGLGEIDRDAEGRMIIDLDRRCAEGSVRPSVRSLLFPVHAC